MMLIIALRVRHRNEVTGDELVQEVNANSTVGGFVTMNDTQKFDPTSVWKYTLAFTECRLNKPLNPIPTVGPSRVADTTSVVLQKHSHAWKRASLVHLVSECSIIEDFLGKKLSKGKKTHPHCCQWQFHSGDFFGDYYSLQKRGWTQENADVCCSCQSTVPAAGTSVRLILMSALINAIQSVQI